jgi:hypothetical protein
METHRPHTRQEITPQETYPEYPAPIPNDELERPVNGALKIVVVEMGMFDATEDAGGVEGGEGGEEGEGR